MPKTETEKEIIEGLNKLREEIKKLDEEIEDLLLEKEAKEEYLRNLLEDE